MTVDGAIWRYQLTAAERAALGRGGGIVSEPRPDILVVGGGIMGVATAAACHDAGLGAVLLIETGHLGAGATGGAGGLLIPEPHQWSDPEPLVDLEKASLERWREINQGLQGGVGLVDIDWIGLVPHSGGYAAHQSPAIEWLSRGQVAALVPGLAQPMDGALTRHQARVNPLRALARMAARLPAVATGVAATGVTIRGDRVVTVTTSAGDVHPGAVVFATGQPPVLDGLPLEIPSERVKGHLLVTERTPIRLPGIVAPVATQIEDSRLLAGGTLDVGDEGPGIQPEIIESIMDGLVAALPAARGLGIAYQWCCFRPRHPDGRPVIDRLPGLSNAWLTSGHFRTGILNAPATAAVIARWISGGQPPVEAATWSATRFAAYSDLSVYHGLHNRAPLGLRRRKPWASEAGGSEHRVGVSRVPRSRGAFSGVLLIILGAWGALAPFIGHYVHLAYLPDNGWHVTSGRLYLSVVPGAVALLGGLIAAAASNRGIGGFGAFIAALGGVWFIAGVSVAKVFLTSSSISPGSPEGGSLGSLTAAQRMFVEQLAFFTGAGILILFFAALALGRFSVVGVRDAELAAEEERAEAQGLQPDMSYPTTTSQYPTVTEGSYGGSSSDPGTLRGPG